MSSKLQPVRIADCERHPLDPCSVKKSDHALMLEKLASGHRPVLSGFWAEDGGRFVVIGNGAWLPALTEHNMTEIDAHVRTTPDRASLLAELLAKDVKFANDIPTLCRAIAELADEIAPETESAATAIARRVNRKRDVINRYLDLAELEKRLGPEVYQHCNVETIQFVRQQGLESITSIADLETAEQQRKATKVAQGLVSASRKLGADDVDTAYLNEVRNQVARRATNVELPETGQWIVESLLEILAQQLNHANSDTHSQTGESPAGASNTGPAQEDPSPKDQNGQLENRGDVSSTERTPPTVGDIASEASEDAAAGNTYSAAESRSADTARHGDGPIYPAIRRDNDDVAVDATRSLGTRLESNAGRRIIADAFYLYSARNNRDAHAQGAVRAFLDAINAKARELGVTGQDAFMNRSRLRELRCVRPGDPTKSAKPRARDAAIAIAVLEDGAMLREIPEDHADRKAIVRALQALPVALHRFHDAEAISFANEACVRLEAV